LTDNVQKIRFERLRKLKLDGIRELNDIPMTFARLEEFSLSAHHLPPMNIIQKFIEQTLSIRQMEFIFELSDNDRVDELALQLTGWHRSSQDDTHVFIRI